MTDESRGRSGRPAVAVASPSLRLPEQRQRSLLGFGRDFGLIVAVILVYFELRALAPASVKQAVETPYWLVRFEQVIGVFRERDLQEWTLKSTWLKEAANFTYAYLHFPVLFLVGAVLWYRDRPTFVIVRNTMFVSMVIGLVFYYAVPAAPPRLMALHGYDYGFVDTVFGGDTVIRYPQPAFYVNAYAALPSYHFGWIALASAGLWLASGRWAVRTVAIALTVVMTWASAATANHLFVDMAIGGLAVLAAWAIARRLPQGRGWLPHRGS